MDENISICGSSIIEILNNAGISVTESGNFSNCAFSSVSCNSKHAATGTLFFCKGKGFKKAYLSEALSKGISGIISENGFDVGLPQLLVTDVRRSLFIVSRELYANPQKNLFSVGITGTNGKTTTAQFIAGIFKEACGKPQPRITTTDIFDGCVEKENALTTPEPTETFECMYHAVKNGCTHFVMECSSQSEKMGRLGDLHFDAGVITNISDDHYSPNEHLSFEEYLSYKCAIIKRFKNAVINMDDPHAVDFIKAAKNAERIIKCSVSEKTGADIYAEHIRRDDIHILFTAVTPKWKQEIRVPLPGLFNVSNALCACAVGYLADISPEKIAAGIESHVAKGRMEVFRKDDLVVVVDYAHNYESVRSALGEIHRIFPDRDIQLVFGATGNTGLQRKQDIVKAAASFCKKFYITTDDPMDKDPEEIIAEIVECANPTGVAYETISDRKECIEKAIRKLTKKELLFITAKGNECFIKVRGEKIPYEGDTHIVARMLEE